MAKIWKKLPPLLADNFGLIEVINQTDGMGIIDDCSEYRTSPDRHSKEGPEMRVVHTGISSEDVVSGTRQKVLDTFRECEPYFYPGFVLLSTGPCSAMIGTDLEEIAETIEEESGIPAGRVKLTGQKTYDVGISETLLELAKLLVKPGKEPRESVNILGGTQLDWQKETAASFRRWLEERGIPVTAALGGAETAKNIERAAEASVNLVVTASGLAAAKYLKTKYNTPYLVMAPFGRSWTDRMLEAVRRKEQPGSCPQEEYSRPQVLIIGEQLMANAIRETLYRDYGMREIQVCTFYRFEKSLALPGDRRIKGEEDARELLGSEGLHTVIADPLLRCFASPSCRWIDLPHKAFELYGKNRTLPLLLGDHLNRWLDGQLG